MVTIRDVAGKSGFSITTVSMVLNDGRGAARISGRTRTRVWKVARRLGYRPNLQARSLRSKRTHSVGVVVFDLTDPYCTQIWRGIQNHLRPIGLFPIVTDLQDDRSVVRRVHVDQHDRVGTLALDRLRVAELGLLPLRQPGS